MRRPERHSLEIVACCRSPAARGPATRSRRGETSACRRRARWSSTARRRDRQLRRNAPPRRRAHPRWPAQAGRPGRGRAIADLERSMVGVDRTGASFDAAAGLLHERLIAPLLPHPGTAETLDIAWTWQSPRPTIVSEHASYRPYACCDRFKIPPGDRDSEDWRFYQAEMVKMQY